MEILSPIRIRSHIFAFGKVDLFNQIDLKAIANYNLDDCVQKLWYISRVLPDWLYSGDHREQFTTIIKCLNLS